MSVAAAVLRQIASGVREIASRAPLRGSLPEDLSNDPLFSLAQQLFFPASGSPRRSVFLVAVDANSRPVALCQNLGSSLAKASGKDVAIVHASNVGSQCPKEPVALSDGVWQISSDSIRPEFGGEDDWKHSPPKQLVSTYEYFLFSASVSDGEFPIFCGLCDAAVLLVKANITRRAAALNAKDVLQRHRVKVIGTILDQRTLPIPESIYRRL